MRADIQSMQAADFDQCPAGVETLLKQMAKSFFDQSFAHDRSESDNNLLTELHIDGFDLEQVYQQLLVGSRRRVISDPTACIDVVDEQLPSLLFNNNNNNNNKLDSMQINDTDDDADSVDMLLEGQLNGEDTSADDADQADDISASGEADQDEDMDEFEPINDDDDIDDGENHDVEEETVNQTRAGKQKKRVTWKDDGASIDQTSANGFEMEQARIRRQISRIEDEMLNHPKPWQLLGEAKASDRPENSLIDGTVLVDFETKVSQPPVITTEFTESIEEMVRRRIKDNAFDDVERKSVAALAKPIDVNVEFRDNLIFRKSEKGLAEEYEHRFLKMKEDLDGVSESPDAKLHMEVLNDLECLFSKLDALSHSVFIPGMKMKVGVIDRKQPSIPMESGTTMTALETVLEPGDGMTPNQLYRKPKELKSQEELTLVDKKRLRKALRKERKQKADEKKRLEDLKPKSKKVLKSLEEREMLKKVEKLIKATPNIRVAKIDTSNKKPKVAQS